MEVTVFVLPELPVADPLVGLVTNVNIFVSAGFVLTGVTFSVVTGLGDLVVCNITVGVDCVPCIVFLTC